MGSMRWMTIDPGPTTDTPGRIVRRVDIGALPRFVKVAGHRFKRSALRPRYHVDKAEALRDAAKRIIRDVGAPGGLARDELSEMSDAERSDVRMMRRETRKRLKKFL